MNLKETNDEETIGVCTLDNSFDYTGTHCTGGRGGTHYPSDYGRLVSDCCETEVTED